MAASSGKISIDPITVNVNLVNDSTETPGTPGANGADGKSAYELSGSTLTLEEWVASLKGRDGVNGIDGRNGTDGRDGVAGPAGRDGLPGEPGAAGLAGVAGVAGRDGATGPQGLQGVQGPKGDRGDTGPQGPVGPAGSGGTSTGGGVGAPSTTYLTGTETTTAFQDAINKLQAAGGGVVVLPFGKTISLSKGVTVPNKVRIKGDTTSIVKLTATEGILFDVEADDTLPLEGFTLQGPGSGHQLNVKGAGTTTGVRIKGHGLKFRGLNVYGFNTAFDGVRDDTYIIDFEDMIVVGNVLVFDFDVAGIWRPKGASNSGERINIRGSVIANNGTVFHFSDNGPTMHFVATSLDYNNLVGRVSNAYVHFIGAHIETNSNASKPPVVPAGQAQPGTHLIDVIHNPKLQFVDSTLILGAGDNGYGVRHITNNTQGPWNYDGGIVRQSNTSTYFIDADKGSHTVYSSTPISVKAGTTEVTFFSPWISQWGIIAAKFQAQDGILPPVGITADITAMDTQRGTVKVTFSKPLPSGAMLIIEHG